MTWDPVLRDTGLAWFEGCSAAPSTAPGTQTPAVLLALEPEQG